MKKTLLVTLDYYPNVGGISNYWCQLGECLPADSWSVLVPSLPNGLQEMSASHPIFRRKFFSFAIPRWLPLFFHIFQLVRKERIEHVIVGQILPIGTVCWLLSLVSGIHYSVSLHGMDIAPQFLSSRKKFLCKKILRRAQNIIVNSAYTESLVARYGSFFCNRLYPCPSITPERFSNYQMLPQHFPTGKNVILTAGRLVRRKGHEDVIDAVNIISKTMPDIAYVIVGDGPYRKKLEIQVHALGMESSIVFMGKIDDEEVARWYAACRCVVMVSKDLSGDVEGFGIVYLEANAFGKPVIAGRSGGAAEAVVHKKTGLVVEPGKPQEIAEAIIKLLSDTALADRLGETGRARVNRDFVWSEQARKLMSLLC